MCGINGIVTCNSQRNISEIISQMNQMIVHRGPDDEGFFVDQGVGLSMRRLSIIDLTTGQQPMTSLDGTKIIVFNGEIYNFKSLKENLQHDGASFNTTSDTEVILKAYEMYGDQCVDFLHGMFSFAIYDKTKDRLFLARDRSGEKPLYYLINDEGFLFASELKSIESVWQSKLTIDRIALHQYLHYTYIPSPRSIYEEVKKLPAGHVAIYERSKLSIKRYYHYYPNNPYSSYEEAKKDLKKALNEAVHECLTSDVPIGTFLSGGFDSTIITAIASQQASEPLTAFTLGHHLKSYDESQLAAVTAKKYGVNHHIKFLDETMFIEAREALLKNMDEPFGDASLIATYVISMIAKEQGIKTVLTGDAGDELFAGYNKYLIHHYASWLRRMPKSFLKALDFLVKRLNAQSKLRTKIEKVRKFMPLSQEQRHFSLMAMGFEKDQLQKLLKEEVYDPSFNDDLIAIYRQFSETDPLNQSLITDFNIVLEGDMLAKVDRASMLASIETRTPLLHPKVLDVVANIPSHFKIQGKNRKVILKDTFSELVPEALKKAPKKGFEIPIAEWIKQGKLEGIENYISSSFLDKQGLFHASTIQLMYQSHLKGKSNHAFKLWTFYIFQRWYESKGY